MAERFTHWKKLNNPDYIGAYSFLPGEKKTLTIASVRQDEISGQDGKKVHAIVVWKESEKPLILNSTNGTAITKIAGTPNIELWPNVRVTLEVQKVKVKGELTEAVRVSKIAPQQTQQAVQEYICADCGKQIVSAGGFSAAGIAKSTHDKFKVTLCLECGKARNNKPTDAPEPPAETEGEITPDENDQN